MSELNGLIAVNKPRDWTSFDVIGKLRGVLHTKRLGHGGTLDPMATGVLPVFIGKATRCCDIMPDKRKCYTAGFKLGVATDTQDITGQVLAQSDKPVSRDEIEALLPGFVGDIMQTPPMFSAVKIGGKKLVDLAREGRQVERQARRVTVNSVTLKSYDEQSREGMLDIDCMQGTYVRTIIDDLGEGLHCGGAMTSLVRTRSGGFELSECRTIEKIEALAKLGRVEEIMLPTDRVFDLYPAARLDGHCSAMYRNGVKLRPDQVGFTEAGIHRIYSAEGEFLGLAELRGGELRAVRNFY